MAPLRHAERPLEPTFEVDGETWSVATYMDAMRAVGVLAIHRGEIVLERYAFDYGPDQRWTSFSVGKSITSTLAGAALRDGAIESLDDTVTDYLPALIGRPTKGSRSVTSSP